MKKRSSSVWRIWSDTARRPCISATSDAFTARPSRIVTGANPFSEQYRGRNSAIRGYGFPGAILSWTDVPQGMRPEVEQYLAVLALALPPSLLFRLYSTLNQSLGHPRLVTWLQIVFRTWGGFLAGFGVLLLAVAGYLLTLRSSLLKWGTSLALLIAFGRFLVSNLVIGSDFLPFVGGLFALAALTALMLQLHWRRGDR